MWARLDNDITRVIGQHTIKRIISAVRDSHHGGTVVIVPPDLADDILEDRYVSLKYRFVDAEPRRRFRTLIVDVMNELARSYAGTPARDPVGWDDYEASSDREPVTWLDEAIFEVAHLIAGLTAVDGAVVMTQRFEMLGFGGEISGDLPAAETVARALDVEADETIEEPTDGVGTRHRSAYRLCKALGRRHSRRHLPGRQRALHQAQERRRHILGPGVERFARLQTAHFSTALRALSALQPAALQAACQQVSEGTCAHKS